MNEFGEIFEAVNANIQEGDNMGMPGPIQEEPEGVLPGEEQAPEPNPNLKMVADVLSMLAKDSTWENTLAAYAQEHDLEMEAVKADVEAALADAGVVLAQPEVEVEVTEVPAEAPEMEDAAKEEGEVEEE